MLAYIATLVIGLLITIKAIEIIFIRDRYALNPSNCVFLPFSSTLKSVTIALALVCSSCNPSSLPKSMHERPLWVHSSVTAETFTITAVIRIRKYPCPHGLPIGLPKNSAPK